MVHVRAASRVAAFCTTLFTKSRRNLHKHLAAQKSPKPWLFRAVHACMHSAFLPAPLDLLDKSSVESNLSRGMIMTFGKQRSLINVEISLLRKLPQRLFSATVSKNTARRQLHDATSVLHERHFLCVFPLDRALVMVRYMRQGGHVVPLPLPLFPPPPNLFRGDDRGGAGERGQGDFPLSFLSCFSPHPNSLRGRGSRQAHGADLISPSLFLPFLSFPEQQPLQQLDANDSISGCIQDRIIWLLHMLSPSNSPNNSPGNQMQIALSQVLFMTES